MQIDSYTTCYADAGATGYALCQDTGIHYCCGVCGGTASCTSNSGLLYCACTEPPALDGSSYSDSTAMTTSLCYSLCQADGYPYYGTQYSNKCFCGDSYDTYGVSTGCTMGCAGDADEICGGSNALSVYGPITIFPSALPTPAPTPAPTASAWPTSSPYPTPSPTSAPCNGMVPASVGLTVTDHNQQDWAPAAGTYISGVHCNIGTFSVPSGSTLVVTAWDGTDHGVLVIYASTINITGTIDASAAGFRGGAQVPYSIREGGYQGESPSGGGTQSHAENGGGGGGGRGECSGQGRPGGGGGHASTGSDAPVGTSCGGTGGTAYEAFDADDMLSSVTMGAGGGGGGNDDAITVTPRGGAGGAGGGAIVLRASVVTIDGLVAANGGDGDGDNNYACGGGTCSSRALCYWDYSGPGGGGAGGSVIIMASSHLHVATGSTARFVPPKHI